MRKVREWGVIALGLLVLSLWTAWPAMAQQEDERDVPDRPEFVPPAGRLATFQEADQDRDGFLSRQEAVDAFDWAAGLFKVMDQDGDKKISQGEFTGWSQNKKQVANDGKAPAAFNEMDRLGNHDGRVSLKEWGGDRAVFDEKDADKDGSLTLKEFLAKPKKTRR